MDEHRWMLRRLKRTVGAVLFKSYIWHHRLLHFLRVLPFSRTFGMERGTPVGRSYVNHFLQANADQVRGKCLEFGNDRYRSCFPRSTSYHVTDVVERPGVDYVCDIHSPHCLPKDHFDAVICTQVFEHLAYPEIAARSLFQILAPDGILLLTAPFINPVHYVPTDFRRFTPECLEMMLQDAGFDVEILDFGGNSLVSTGILLGMVQEDFSRRELQKKDPVYPLNVLIRARKPLAVESNEFSAHLQSTQEAVPEKAERAETGI
jgi:SAM-dependent methyltransferase